jgi:hypothetical protein
MSLLRDELGWDEAELGTVFSAIDCHGHVTREQVGVVLGEGWGGGRVEPRCLVCVGMGRSRTTSTSMTRANRVQSIIQHTTNR